MNICIIGAGNIGSTLGKKWAAAGHSVWFGVRNPGEGNYGPLRVLGRVTAITEAIAAGEVVLLALPGSAVAGFASEYGALLAGKTVIDATNNLRASIMHSLAVLGENAPDAHLGRAFNSLGWENFENPQLGGVQIDLFFCAQSAARPATEALIADVGLRPVFIGDIDMAAALDAMTRIWFALVSGQGHGRRIAFKLLSD